MTDQPPIGWRVTVARTGTYAAAKQKPEQRDFPGREQAEAYAAEMRGTGAAVCVVPQFPKPYRRGTR